MMRGGGVRERPAPGLHSLGPGGKVPGGAAYEFPAHDVIGCLDVRDRMGDGKTEWDPEVKVHPDPGLRYRNHEFHPRSSDEGRDYVDGLEPAAQVGDPVGYRLMLAISSDGEAWEKTGMVIVSQASVPCLAVEDNEVGEETLYLFFLTSRGAIKAFYNDNDSAAILGLDAEGSAIRTTPLAVAYTTDLLAWTYRLLDCEEAGFYYPELDYTGLDPRQYSANDPSVVRATGVTPDEIEHPGMGYQWMMYYTIHYGSPDASGVAPAIILVAFAQHLYDFEWTTGNDGVPVMPPAGAFGDDPDAKAEDPSAAPLEMAAGAGGYLMFAGGNRSGYNWAAGLSDGVTAGSWDEIQEICDGSDGTTVDTIIMNNAVDAPGTSLDLTWIAAAGGDLERYIISLPFPTFASGTADTGGCVPILEQESDYPYEYNGIREAAVARFRNCWVMVYVTGIQPSSTATPP